MGKKTRYGSNMKIWKQKAALNKVYDLTGYRQYNNMAT